MMSHLKMRLIVALLAAAAMTSASTAQAETKKKQFADLLSGSISTATTSSPGAYTFPTSIAARASTSGIKAATVMNRGGTTQQFRSAVLSNINLNRNNLLGKLAFLGRELRSGRINFATWNTQRGLNFQLFYAQRIALFQEYRTGQTYHETRQNQILFFGPLSIIR